MKSKILLLLLISSVVHAQDGQEKLKLEEDIVKDGKKYHRKVFAADTLGNYSAPKNLSKLSDTQRAEKEKLCKQANGKNFKYGDYWYDGKTCKFLGKLNPGTQREREVLIPVPDPTPTPTPTPVVKAHSYDMNKSASGHITKDGKTLVVSVAVEQEYNAILKVYKATAKKADKKKLDAIFEREAKLQGK